MFIVFDRPKLQRMISIVREDRTAKSQAGGGHYVRLEASQGELILSGPIVEAAFPATVYEEGVLFLRVTRFRLFLSLLDKQKMLAMQVNRDGLFADGVRLFLEANDMLLYADPAKAPQKCPLDDPTPPTPPPPTPPPYVRLPIFDPPDRVGKDNQ